MHVLGLMHLSSFWVATALSLGKCREGGGVWGVSSRLCLFIYFFPFGFFFMFSCFGSTYIFFYHNNTIYTNLHQSLSEQIAHPLLH